MPLIKSTTLHSAEYDPANQTARVRFQNGVEYEYSHVPQVKWDGFERTFQTDESSGKYFHANLKQHASRRLDKQKHE